MCVCNSDSHLNPWTLWNLSLSRSFTTLSFIVYALWWLITQEAAPQILSGVLGRLVQYGVFYQSSPDRITKYQLLQGRDKFRAAGTLSGAMVSVGHICSDSWKLKVLYLNCPNVRPPSHTHTPHHTHTYTTHHTTPYHNTHRLVQWRVTLLWPYHSSMHMSSSSSTGWDHSTSTWPPRSSQVVGSNHEPSVILYEALSSEPWWTHWGTV